MSNFKDKQRQFGQKAGTNRKRHSNLTESQTTDYLDINSQIKNPYTQNKEEKSQKTCDFPQILNEFKNLGLQTVEVPEKKQNDQNKSFKGRFQENYTNLSMGEHEGSKFLDFSHYAQAYKDSSSSSRKNVKTQERKKILRSLQKEVKQLREIREDMLGKFEEQKQILVDNLEEVKHRIKMIQELSAGEKNDLQKQIRALEGNIEKIKDENKFLKKEIQKLKEKQKLETKNVNYDHEKYYTLKKEFNDLEIQFIDLKKINRELTKKVEIYDDERKLHGKNQFTHEREKQLKQKYIQCIQTYSEEIAFLGTQLNRIKEESLESSRIFAQEKEKQISQMIKSVEQKQRQLWKKEEELVEREETLQRREKDMHFQMDKIKFRQKLLIEQQPTKNHHQYYFSQRQSFNKQTENHNKHQSPIFAGRKFDTHLSPRNTKPQFYSPENEFRSSTNRNFAITNRIKQIQSNAKKQLDEIFKKKKNGFY